MRPMRRGQSPLDYREHVNEWPLASAANTGRKPRMVGLMMLSVCCACIVIFGGWTANFLRERPDPSLSNIRFAQHVESYNTYGRHEVTGSPDASSSTKVSHTMFAGGKNLGEDLPVDVMRDYLNGLVEDSISRSNEQLTNIAFIKTHKTGSTTLASIFYRYGKRHHSNISKFKEGGTFVELDSAARQVDEQGRRVEIMHYHLAWNGFYKGTWAEAKEKYSRIMSDKADVNFVTVLREPIAHYLSYYYYFINPMNKLSIQEYLMRSSDERLLYNPLAAEFGIETMAQLNDFIRNEMVKFKMIILTERFDEGVAMLQKMMGWEPVDVTYCAMLPTKKGMTRWDGKPLENIPKTKELPPEVLTQIKARTLLDTRLYQAGVLLYRKYKLDFGPGLEDHFEAFHDLQRIMHRYLELNSTSEAKNWYVGDVDIYDNGPPMLRF